MRKPRVSHLEVLGDKRISVIVWREAGEDGGWVLGRGKGFKRICFAVKPFRKLNAMNKHLYTSSEVLQRSLTIVKT